MSKMYEREYADFIIYIRSEKGLTENSIEAYSRDLRYFVDYLSRHGATPLSAVTSDQCINYLSFLKSAKYAPATLSRMLVSLKVFFQFLKREELVHQNPTLLLDGPKLWLLLPEILDEEEVERLLAQPNLEIAEGSRDRAILELMYGSGLRVSEVCGLTLYSIDDQFIRVFGKGRKERIVPVGGEALKAVDHYLNHFRSQWDSEKIENLFVTLKGKPIDRISIWRSVKSYAKKALIQKNISPHTLRHSYATHLLNHGADLRIIQELLGHANINSTDRYTQVSHSRMQEAFNRCHPKWD